MAGEFNIITAWVWFLLGILSGILPGLLFQNADWMGGYGSWRRRLTRLGHISFFGLGGLNFAFALTLEYYAIEEPQYLASALFVSGAVAMPTICYLSAWKKGFRHLFFIPVVSLLIGTLLTLAVVLRS